MDIDVSLRFAEVKQNVAAYQQKCTSLQTQLAHAQMMYTKWQGVAEYLESLIPATPAVTESTKPVLVKPSGGEIQQ